MPNKQTPIQKAVIDLRARLKLTQQRLADELRVTRLAVIRWETGAREPDAIYVWLLALYAKRTGNKDLARVFDYWMAIGYPQLEQWEKEAKRA